MVSNPNFTEADGSTQPTFPQDCRIRNLTYAAPLYVEMKKRVLIGHEDPNSLTGDIIWEPENGEDHEDRVENVQIGRVRYIIS